MTQPTPTRCTRCLAPVWRDHWAGLHYNVDVTPLNPIQELQAQLNKLPTYKVKQIGKHWQLEPRNQYTIPTQTQNNPIILSEHNCPQPAGLHPNYFPTPPTNQQEGFPF